MDLFTYMCNYKINKQEQDPAVSRSYIVVKGLNNKVLKGYPADLFLDEEGYFNSTKQRRFSFIDPNSDGFEQLPLKVRIVALKKYTELLAKLNHAFQYSLALNKISSLDLYKIALELCQLIELQTLSKSRVFLAAGLFINNIKDYDKLLNRPDPYAEKVLPLINLIYRQNRGKIGRIAMTKELRKHGIYICDQTVRKLMLKAGLRYNSAYQG